MLVISTRHPPLPRRFGVIFIDCWESDWKWQGDPSFYQGIKNHVAAMPIDFKVFHTTYLRADLVGLETMNYLRTFVQDHHNKIRGIRDFLDNVGEQYLTRDLWEIVDNKSMLIPTLGTFSDLVEILDLKHWIIMGAHWNICINDKPLGLHNLKHLHSNFPDIEFYIHPQCIARWKWGPDENVSVAIDWQDIYDNYLNWSRAGNGLARLEPRTDLIRKPKIAIFTNWPGDIVSTEAWNITRLDTNQGLVDEVRPGEVGRLEHLVLSNINVQGYADEYALYVIAPGQISLARLLWDTDEDHAAFLDPDGRFILVRQHQNWISRFL